MRGMSCNRIFLYRQERNAWDTHADKTVTPLEITNSPETKVTSHDELSSLVGGRRGFRPVRLLHLYLQLHLTLGSRIVWITRRLLTQEADR